jgi:hypothetical protein
MSTYDIQLSAPGILRSEALNVTIKFDRTGPNTGRISWNIPAPAAGCDAETQAYCGIVLTLNTTPASASTSPKNGTVYSSDPTGDSNLFAGDKIGDAYVVGAFYGDRVTTMLDITGLLPNTAYFVAGYPADCQHRYFVEGVHAYSTEFVNRGTDGTRGTQIAFLKPTTIPTGVQPTDSTGLPLLTSPLPPAQPQPAIYNFTIQLGVDPKPLRPLYVGECNLVAPTYTINVASANAQDYQSLVAEINKQLALIGNAPQGPTSPGTNHYYWNSQQSKLFQWNGTSYTEIACLVGISQPNIVADGTYWFNPTTNVLQVWQTNAWVIVTVYNNPLDPAAPAADKSYWYDGTVVHLWNGYAWCSISTTVQATDPSLAVAPVGGSFWYNTVLNRLYRWNSALEMWNAAEFMESDVNPTQLQPGAFWFDSSTNTLKQLGIPNAGWNVVSGVSIREVEPSTPAPGKIWYNPITENLYIRDASNTSWNENDVITFPNDPTVRGSCDAWWNTVAGILFVWDQLQNSWVAVTNFVDQPNDPALAPTFADGSAWIDTDTGKLYIYGNNCFAEQAVITSPTDPRTAVTVGSVWYNGNVWHVRTVSGWSPITPVAFTTDPALMPIGTFWYNTPFNALQQWNGAAWQAVVYNATPQPPVKGAMWYDTTTNILKQWNGTAWVAATPPATVELDCNGNLLFTDNTVGSTSMVRIKDGDLFSSMTTPPTLGDLSPGTDGASSTPTYMEMGIGTDGSVAMREQIGMDIRYELGYPNVDVEITKEQMDYAISRALRELRMRSGVAYKRGFFFMSIKANEQKFFLTNKISDMNKIVDVLGVYRLTSSFLSSAHGAGVYGQIVMQHMYNMGTFDLLSYHLMGEYTKLMEILFAGRVTYTWNEQTRELFLHHRFSMAEQMVAIEATIERTEQDIMSDRYANPWIRRYAAAMCRLMLAETRGKFSTLPGAGGSITLNAGELRQAAQQEIEACLQEIDDYIADKPDEYGMGAHFVFG